MAMNKYGQKVRRLMKRNHLTQAELAALIGTHQPQVSKWLNQGVVPSMGLALRTARILGTSLDFLLDDDLETEPTTGLTPDQVMILQMADTLGPVEAKRRLMAVVKLRAGEAPAAPEPAPPAPESAGAVVRERDTGARWRQKVKSGKSKKRSRS
jgi:transcriptional regulator with XRE-family HTH domain